MPGDVDVDTDGSSAPERTCVGCRSRRRGDELVRITRRVDAIVVGGPSAGRGAWLCVESIHECLDQAFSSGGFSRAWRARLLDEDERRIRTAIDEFADSVR